MAKQNILGPLREQSDWNQQDENRLGYIKNKPFYDTRKSKVSEKIHFTTENVLKTANVEVNEFYCWSKKVPTREETQVATLHMPMEDGTFVKLTCSDIVEITDAEGLQQDIPHAINSL